MVAVSARQASVVATSNIAITGSPVLNVVDGPKYTLLSPQIDAPSAYINSEGTFVLETWTAASAVTRAGSTSTRTATMNEEVVITLGPFTSWSYGFTATRPLNVVSTLGDRDSARGSNTVQSASSATRSGSAATATSSSAQPNAQAPARSNKSLVIGLAVGLPLGICMLAFLIALVFCIRRHRAGKETPLSALQRSITKFNAIPYDARDAEKTSSHEKFTNQPGVNDPAAGARRHEQQVGQSQANATVSRNGGRPHMQQPTGRRSFETGDDAILPIPPVGTTAQAPVQQTRAQGPGRDVVSPIESSATPVLPQRSRWRESAEGTDQRRGPRPSSRYVQDEPRFDV